MDARKKQATLANKPPHWEPPSLKLVGTIGEVLQGGGGKLSTVGGDPGDTLKPSGQG
jgi:hypothetical protein